MVGRQAHKRAVPSFGFRDTPQLLKRWARSAIRPALLSRKASKRNNKPDFASLHFKGVGSLAPAGAATDLNCQQYLSRSMLRVSVYPDLRHFSPSRLTHLACAPAICASDGRFAHQASTLPLPVLKRVPVLFAPA